LREEFKVSSSYRPWSSKQGIVLRGVPENDRMREVVELAWISRLKSKTADMSDEEARVNYFVDFASSAGRRPWGGPRTMTQGLQTCMLQLEPCCLKAKHVLHTCFLDYGQVTKHHSHVRDLKRLAFVGQVHVCRRL
jgi:hypothetical protein